MSAADPAAALDAGAHSDATKHKLKSMTEGLDDFATLLKTGTRQRREKDEYRVAELKSLVTDVERDVGIETAKRADMGKAIQTWAETQVAGTKVRMDALLTASKADIQGRFEQLHARIGALEHKFEADCSKVMADVKRRNEDLVESLRLFNAAFETERRARMEREQRILDRLAKQEHDSMRRFDEERHTREQVYMATKKQLEEAVASTTKADEKFQSTMYEELSVVKNAIAAEERTRAHEDDEIAEALHRYVQKLQASLAIMNSEDTDYGGGS